MGWLGGVLCPSHLHSHVVSLLLLLLFIVCSRIPDVLFHLNFLTPRVPLYPLRNLCSLVTLVVSTLRCNKHSHPLNFYLSRMGSIENLSYSACGHLTQVAFYSVLSSYILIAPLALCRFFFRMLPLGQALQNWLAFGATWSPAVLSSVGRCCLAATTRILTSEKLNAHNSKARLRALFLKHLKLLYFSVFHTRRFRVLKV